MFSTRQHRRFAFRLRTLLIASVFLGAFAIPGAYWWHQKWRDAEVTRVTMTLADTELKLLNIHDSEPFDKSEANRLKRAIWKLEQRLAALTGREPRGYIIESFNGVEYSLSWFEDN